jgi:hypothetical protein
MRVSSTHARVSRSPIRVSSTHARVSRSPVRVSSTHARISRSPMRVSSTHARVSRSPMRVRATRARIEQTVARVCGLRLRVRFTHASTALTRARIRATRVGLRTFPAAVPRIHGRVARMAAHICPHLCAVHETRPDIPAILTRVGSTGEPVARKGPRLHAVRADGLGVDDAHFAEIRLVREAQRGALVVDHVTAPLNLVARL